MEIIKRSYTGHKNDFDLQEIANKAIVASDIVKNQTANLELLNSRKEQLQELDGLYEASIELNQKMMAILASEELALLNGSLENLKILNRIIEDQKSAVGFKKWWNQIIEILKLK